MLDGRCVGLKLRGVYSHGHSCERYTIQSGDSCFVRTWEMEVRLAVLH